MSGVSANDGDSRSPSMSRKTQVILQSYGGAVGFTALAVLLRLVLDPWLGSHLPLATLYGTVALAVWLGGYRPAIVAVVLGYLACDWLFIEPRGALGFSSTRNLIGLFAYLVSCSIIIGLGQVMHIAHRRIEARQRELEQAEARLRESEARERRITDLIPFGAWMTDTSGNATYLSHLFLEMVGQTLEEHQRSWTERIHPDDAAATLQTWQECVARCGEWHHEFRIRDKDGRYRTILAQGLPVREGNGRVTGYAGLNYDLTDRKRAEEAVRQTMEQLQIITDGMAAAVTRCSRDLKYAWVSKPYAEWISRPADEIVGRPIVDVLGTAAFYQLRPHFEEVLAGRVVRYEGQIPYPGIGNRWISAVYTPTLGADGVPDGWVAVVNDLTERKQMEEALRTSESRLTAELEAVSRLHALSTRLLAMVDLPKALDDLLENAILTCKADFGNLQLYNSRTEALEIVAQRGFGQDFLAHFGTVRVDDGSACARAMETGGRLIIEDVSGDTAFAPHRQIAAAAGFRSVTSTPLKDRGGRVVGMLSVHFRQPHIPSDRDQRLLDLYARHAADLIERNRFEEALRAADRRKDEFLATLAHELRNPLAPIRNALHIMRLSSDEEVQAEARGIMERQLGQMVRLIDDLLDVSRISLGHVRLHKQRVALGDVIRDAVEACQPLIESCGHQLRVVLPEESVYLDADSTRLTQVFSNLLNNAAKYSDRGAQIKLTAERNGSEVLASVKDTGIGIPSEMLPQVFDQFSQINPSQRRSHSGLGLGLTLVKRLVEMHGGDVEARSDGPGKGSEFIIRLPILAPAGLPASRPGKEIGTPAGPAKARILVVDDLKDSAESLARFLRLMGHDVRTASDGVEAVEATASFRPDLILLDIGLPKLDGYEACRRIRALPCPREPVVVAVTGWGQDDDRRKAKEAGFDFHMVKPVEPAAIEKLLQSLALR
jgi:PAS domain S-box-containing protein